MIKRDTLTRIILHPTEDAGGGYAPPEIEEKEIVAAHISIGATMTEITGLGKVAMDMLHTATDIPLDEDTYTRYKWGNKHYRVMRQVKRGNEWFATLMETNE